MNVKDHLFFDGLLMKFFVINRLVEEGECWQCLNFIQHAVTEDISAKDLGNPGQYKACALLINRP